MTALEEKVMEKLEDFISSELTSWGWWDGEEIDQNGQVCGVDEDVLLEEVTKITSRIKVELKKSIKTKA